MMRNEAQRNRVLVKAIVPVAAGAMLLAGCSPDTPAVDPEGDGSALVIDGVEIADPELWAAAQAEGELTLYTAQPESSSRPITEAFTEATGISVEMVRLSGGPLAERVLAEFAADQLGADVIQASDLDFGEQMKAEGIIAPHVVPSIDELNPDVREPDDMYTVYATPVMMLAYNTALVEPGDAPDSWEDLLDPKWKGKIGIFDIGTGGSAWSVALFQRQVLGEDYWSELAAQDPAVFSGNAPFAEALTRGEVEVGTAAPGVILRAQAEGSPIDIIAPEEGFPGFASFLALASTAKNPNAAKVYLNWATSAPGQSTIAGISGDYMTNTKADAPVINDTALPAEGPWIPKADDWLNLRDEWSREYREAFGSAS